MVRLTVSQVSYVDIFTRTCYCSHSPHFLPSRWRWVIQAPTCLCWQSETVDWFKPLRDPGLVTGMHNISLSSQGGGQRASIISFSETERTCHLSPHFGHTVDPTWESSTLRLHSISTHISDMIFSCFVIRLHYLRLRAWGKSIRKAWHERENVELIDIPFKNTTACQWVYWLLND